MNSLVESIGKSEFRIMYNNTLCEFIPSADTVRTLQFPVKMMLWLESNAKSAIPKL